MQIPCIDFVFEDVCIRTVSLSMRISFLLSCEAARQPAMITGQPVLIQNRVQSLCEIGGGLKSCSKIQDAKTLSFNSC